MTAFVELSGVTMSYGGAAGALPAVADATLHIERGEFVALVGPSGCGKSTVGRTILRLYRPTAGRIVFDGEDISALGGKALTGVRQQMQMIFQDPFASLDPRMRVEDIVGEAPAVHGLVPRKEVGDYVAEVMLRVGLDPDFRRRYPHQFSGGQRQRIGIARALALHPQLVICDEPVSALDVSIQAQVLNLLKDLQRNLGLTYIFISHNLAVVDYIADRIAVMCRGRLVEVAPRAQLFRAPLHPYTKALLAAVPEPSLDQRLDLTALLQGRASEPAAWPEPFRISGESRLAMIELGDGHFVRAHEDAAEELVRCYAQLVSAGATSQKAEV